MTSLNPKTGWNANKQTGSNSTHSNIQVRSAAQHGREGNSSHILPLNVTPSTTTTLKPSIAETVDPDLDRTNFFKEKYDPMTGIRIASTLGGFFLIVLLTLLYKSKCKHKHSREPSTLTLHNMAYPPHQHQQLMSAQNINLNERDEGGGGGGHLGHPMSLALIDSSCYGYMNQVHPTNSHQPMFSNRYSVDLQINKSPAVLLTAANSESSDEDLSLISGTCQHQTGGPEVPPERKRSRNPLGPIPPYRQVVAEVGEQHCSSQYYLHPKSSPPTGTRMGTCRKGNIDINVILPTPSISPSGSENFNLASGHCHGMRQPNPMALFARGGARTSSVGGRGDRRLLMSRSLSSDNENDNDTSEMSGVGESDCEAGMLPFGCGNSSLFSLENLKYVDDTSSENIPTRASDADDQDQDQDTRSIGSDSVFACFEHNFDHIAPTYARRVSSVSGTSSGIIVVHAQPPPPLPSNQSNNSTAAPVPTPELMKIPAVGNSGFSEGVDPEFRVTLTQAHAQVHHRDSYCSDVESVNDYMETGTRRRSSSTQTTLSDLRQALGYSPSGWSGCVEGGGASPGNASVASYSQHETPFKQLSVPRRRLSSHLTNTGVSAAPPTTSELMLPLSPAPIVSPTSNSTSGFLSVNLHPSPLAGAAGALTPTTPTNPPTMMMLTPSSPLLAPSRLVRKRSFEAVRKTLSLQCEDKSDSASIYASSSNETTPTN